MPVPIQDRPTQALRDAVIDQLIMNYAHGEISQAAFERRLNIAMDSEDNQEIADQVKDLELEVDEKFNKTKASAFNVNHAARPADEEETFFNVFGSNDRSGRWQVPKRIKMFSVFGGSNIDFTDAEFSDPNVTIDMFCLFGGEDLFIPENVNVVSKAFSIFGCVENSVPSNGDRAAPTITIEGMVIFGSVSIKIKKTIKEKFEAFAENFKKILQ